MECPSHSCISLIVPPLASNKEADVCLKSCHLICLNPFSFNKIEKCCVKYPDFKITIDYLKNWSYNTYGDGQYISGVLSYYIGEYGKSRVGDDLVETDYITGEVIKTAVEINEVTNGHKIS